MDFRLSILIGTGGSAEVYRCDVLTNNLKQRVGGDSVACAKLIHENSIALFNQEIGIMNFFRGNEYFCQLGGFSTSPKTIIMKYYEYGSLQNVLDNKALTKRIIANLVGDISMGLKYLHESSMAHLDLKPHNILIGNKLEPDGTSRMNAVLSDFGLTQNLSDANLLVQGFKMHLVKGFSPKHVSPEVIRWVHETKPLKDPRAADIYALGVVLLTTVSRHNPWSET